MSTNKKKSGFTLIEVMVVITVMGLLAMIGVPNLMGLIEKSREKIDVLKLYYLRDALDRALVESETALTNSPYISGEKDADKKKELIDKLNTSLAGQSGVALFVIELKGGIEANIQGAHSSANNSVNMCQLIGNGGTWYNALKEAGFEGVADIVAVRLQTKDDNGLKDYAKKNDLSNESYYVKKDAQGWSRTIPKKPIFISKAMNEGKVKDSNYRLTMSFQWTGGNASSRSVEVALLPNGKQMRDNKGAGSAFRTDHGVCFSTYGPSGCKNFKY
jgi:prepilin-type N-terminal cleavage/methylation domain-containing protein